MEFKYTVVSTYEVMAENEIEAVRLVRAEQLDPANNFEFVCSVEVETVTSVTYKQ